MEQSQIRETVQNIVDNLDGLDSEQLTTFRVAKKGETTDTRPQLIEATRKLLYLLQGPTQTLANISFGVLDAAVLRVFLEFDVPSAVPMNGSISYEELAKATGIDQERLTRILRHSYAHFIFQEKPLGQVSHTPVSAYLAEKANPGFISLLETTGDHVFRAAPYLADYLRQYPNSESPSHTAFNIAFQTESNYFDWITFPGNEERLRRFQEFQAAVNAAPLPLAVTLNASVWAELGDEAKVVDVGGNKGHISFALARAHSNLHLVVEDLDAIIQAGISELGKSENNDIAERVSFKAYNFFHSNPITDADAYFVRHVLHDWPDATCCQILQNIVPSMKQGARLFIIDAVIPPHTLNTAERYRDMLLMTAHNAKDRTADEFVQLAKKAHSHLVYVKDWAAGTALDECFLEFQLEKEST